MQLNKLKNICYQEECLFVYGTLAPGRANEHILHNINGNWQEAFIWGKLYKEGWDADMGFPGIRIIEKTERVNGYLFCSEELNRYWKLLDEFEGVAYKRVNSQVFTSDNKIEKEAYVYVLR